MDILLTDDIIIDYRVVDSDFGIDNSGLEFDVGFENLLGPPVVVATQSPAKTNDGRVEQTLPDSPPDSSGSPPSSVYSPVDTREPRKRRRTSDGPGTANTTMEGSVVVDGTVLCDLMLGQGALKDEDKELHAYSSTTAAEMMGATQCPYSVVGEDIKPLMAVAETYQQQQHQVPSSTNNNNYHQLTSPTGYYNNYLTDFDQGGVGATGVYVTNSQADDLYNHHAQQQHHSFVEMPQSQATTTATGMAEQQDQHLSSQNSSVELMVSPDPMHQNQQRKRKLPIDRSFDDASPGGSGSALTPESSQYPAGTMGNNNNNNNNTANSVDGGSTTGDGSLPGTPMQCIRFEPFQAQQWHPLCDHQLQDLPTPHYRVDADKGFNFSASDEAFVCQKKNHFQVTCHTQLTTVAAGQGSAGSSGGGAVPAAFNVIFVRTQNGLEKVRNFCLHFYGVKYEAPRHMIRVEQSQSDRSKKVFHPVVIDLHCGQVSKTTVGRLHFSETTSNNMRKKGRPNPEQRYFRLVVALHAHTHTGDYPIIVHGSERIIVRASNPGQFENDFELCWQRGVTPDSIFHNGRIGLNTDQPDECLVVNGNLKVTGHILQPSDCRIKRELTELDTQQQLQNIERIRIVRYAYQDGSGKEPATGVMAQEVRRVLPDAVFEQKAAYQMPGGGKLEKFLVVNKDRIFLENVGAVKELNKVTGRLEQRIQQLEIGQGEMAATRNHHRDLSLSPRKSLNEDLTGIRHSWDTVKLGNHSIQWIIVVLIVVMTVCLSTLATLFFMEHYDAVRHRYYDSIAFRRLDDAEQAAATVGSKHQSIAYSHNYSTANDHVLVNGSGKPTKKGATYKTELSGGASIPLSFPSPPPFPEHHRSDGNNQNHNLSPDAAAQQLNWNNIEYSFLYIYKLHQYYNELQKKVKGKLPIFGGGGGGQQGSATASGGREGLGVAASGDMMADSPSSPTEEDCDSAEPADETNLEGISSNNSNNNGDLKLDEEFMNRFLANILSIRNQTTTTTEEAVLERAANEEEKPKQIPSDKSAIDSEGHTVENIPGASATQSPEAKKKDARFKVEQETDIENLINSNK